MAIAGKLQLRAGQTARCFDRPVSLADAVNFPDAAPGFVDAVLGFCLTPAAVARLLPAMLARLQPGGLLWFAFRKGQKPPALTRDHGWQALTSQGYTTVRAISLDAEWSALRFRHGAERQVFRTPERRKATFIAGFDFFEEIVTKPSKVSIRSFRKLRLSRVFNDQSSYRLKHPA